jgi:CHAT domain-containing protein/tetratricopeptide (TPR) repeat protein
MNFKNQFFSLLFFVFISAGCLHTSLMQGTAIPFMTPIRNKLVLTSIPKIINKSSKEVEQLNESLKGFLINGDATRSKSIAEKIIQKIGFNNIDDSVLSESYYFIGIYHLLTRNYNEAIRYLDLCISFKDKNSEYDERYTKALYNLGVVYYDLGDFNKVEKYTLKSLEIGKKINGESNPKLIDSYSSLIIAYIELKEYEKALSNSITALTIISNNPDRVQPTAMADLYDNIGVCYNKLADFSKARIYLEKSESIYKKFNLSLNNNFINLMNSMAITYGSLGLTAESGEYYEKGIALAISNNSSLAYNLINSYCIFLGNDNKAQKGERLLRNALARAKVRYELNPRNYYEVLNNYADYLREYKIDNKKSIECYLKCLDYLRKNDQDIVLKTSVYIGFSLSLNEAGEPGKALEIIQSLLFSGGEKGQTGGNYINPGIETIKPDRTSLKILKTKYNILWDIYKKVHDQKTLEAASSTSELIVSLLDKVRINISEEDSRLVLGDRYRDSYINAIRDSYLLYNLTADQSFLEKAFEYSEKSKVADLLTSTRELKAAQFHIPSDIGDFERKLQRYISLFNARISEETASENPDLELINKWKENLLESIRVRDSLISVFEKQYPDYYAIKYNTHMAGLEDIPEIVGRKVNYINYVVSDTLLYIFVANRRNQKLLALPIDSSLFNNIRQFRSLLSTPSPSDNAFLEFKEFQTIGYKLYKTLIDPIKSYLISEKIIISPDNILSYLPFEIIPTSPDSGKRIMYRDLHYLMNDFDISYTYSATFMAESIKKEFNRSNKLIAIAPNYPDPIDIQSVLMSRQAGMGVLNDLPYARQEAKYVSDITGGKLFINSEAKESVYKKESGKYDIIHLAMHTLLNDKDPMHSTLIFSQANDSLEDGYLNTFEIYGIPLKSKMVVLSSCNTGTGLLYSGEGILSLARGFIYSGSQSVVMSMWEIEDKSGTKIVEMFYENLKKGYTKSLALKKARIDFLKDADLLRSHPYFWSALVVYGNNSPLYYSKTPIVTIVTIVTILILSFGFYFRKRKYS